MEKYQIKAKSIKCDKKHDVNFLLPIVSIVIALFLHGEIRAQSIPDYRKSISLNLSGLPSKAEIIAEQRLPEKWGFGVAGYYYYKNKNRIQPYTVSLIDGYSLSPYFKFFAAEGESDGFYLEGFIYLGLFNYQDITYDTLSYRTVYVPFTKKFLSAGAGGGAGFQYPFAHRRFLVDIFCGGKYNSHLKKLDGNYYRPEWYELSHPGSRLIVHFSIGYCFN